MRDTKRDLLKCGQPANINYNYLTELQEKNCEEFTIEGCQKISFNHNMRPMAGTGPFVPSVKGFGPQFGLFD